MLFVVKYSGCIFLFDYFVNQRVTTGGWRSSQPPESDPHLGTVAVSWIEKKEGEKKGINAQELISILWQMASISQRMKYTEWYSQLAPAV